MASQRVVSWFALTVFKDMPGLIRSLSEAGKETYRAFAVEEKQTKGGPVYKEVPLIARLLFVRCSMDWLKIYKQEHNDQFMYYRDLLTGEPGAINEREMEVFRQVTSLRGNTDVRFLGPDKPEYHKGDRVRVKEGVYKGAEGYIKRIQKSRDLLVCIEGVAVVAISNIKPEFLEKV
ncbi:MAG: hypothetical protein J5669_07675 [Bacteroidales bacterium]|nr:hypothetical protein [Bacteroidales bacterium]